MSRLSQLSRRAKLVIAGLLGLAGVATLLTVFWPTPKPTHQDTKANATYAMKYLTDENHRLTREQAAGIVGNLIMESGVRPELAQAGGPGRGIAQWVKTGLKTAPGRWDRLEAMAQANHRSPYELKFQLDFLWKELQAKDNNVTNPHHRNSSVLAAIRQTHTVAEATAVFEMRYERAGMPDLPARTKFAQQALALTA